MSSFLGSASESTNVQTRGFGHELLHYLFLEDVAPNGAFILCWPEFYKYAAPTGAPAAPRHQILKVESVFIPCSIYGNKKVETTLNIIQRKLGSQMSK
jgi:hypothetical protein